MKKILVVCRDNLVRSKVICNELIKKGYYAESCGVGIFSVIFGRKYKENYFFEFDFIVVCDLKIKRKLIKKGVEREKLITLNVPNVYWFFIPFKILFLRPVKYLRRKGPIIADKIIENVK